MVPPAQVDTTINGVDYPGPSISGYWTTTQAGTGFDLQITGTGSSFSSVGASTASFVQRILMTSPRQQAAAQYCQDNGQVVSFNIPFTKTPVTMVMSLTVGLVNFSSTNDISLVFPPSIGAGYDIAIGAPQGPNIPVEVGVGKNLSAGTFLTRSGARGVAASVGFSAGSPVTMSPTVTNLCGLMAGGG